MNNIDFFIHNFFSSNKTESLTELMYALTSLFDASFHFVLIVFCTTFFIYLARGLKSASLFLFTLTLGAIIVLLLKNYFDVARPLNGFIDVFGKSFPSQHAASSTIFFLMLMYIFDSHFKAWGKIFFNTFCISGFLLVSFSRIYLGVHWFSDVFFGVILGAFISYFSVIVFRNVINMQGSTSMLK